MGEIGSIGEVLELAIVREMQAVDFYMEMAERIDDPAVRSVVEKLAGVEFDHKTRLELEMMKEGMVAKAVNRLVDVEEADYAGELDLDPSASLVELLGIAMEKERRAFRFYAEFAGIMPESGTREVLLELAEEEVRHLVWLEMEYTRLMTGGE